MKKLFFCLTFVSVVLFASLAHGFSQKTHSNSIGMEFVLIPAGKFTPEPISHSVEKDRITVTISKPFYLGKYEVTQEQWVAVMGGSNPASFKGGTNPVENVSWNDAQEFIKRLNQKEGHNRYRLPTEAEWEHAARAGTQSDCFFGEGKETITEADLAEYVWFSKNSGGKTHPVGQKKPNPWALYDIYGNVWEWVQDGHSGKYYGDTAAASTDPFVPSGSDRVLRGGGWHDFAEVCSSVYRIGVTPDVRYYFIGFRLAFTPE
ncbi:MAG: formylglycine-generating enzyme family protein [Desulfovibrio sp.]|jgi:formylglycine-generating enzyme required for sulfatase activity|nr:formylglycine-generating enzyme family protein [Desulfovibrio sp.]